MMGAGAAVRVLWLACVGGNLAGSSIVKLASPRECASCYAEERDEAASDGRRVALVLRGESFRGVHFLMPKEVKRDTVCLKSSYEVQRAEAENHVANLIEPLERAGASVDVFLSTYGCVGTSKFSDLSDAEARRWHDDLVGWYGGDERVVASDLVPRAEGQTQQTTAATAAASVLAHAKRQGKAVKDLYRSVLIWRFDLLQRVELAGLDTPGHLDYDRLGMVVFKDHAWSVPGWFFPCFAAVVQRRDPPPGGCFEADADGHNAYRCNEYFRAAWGEQMGKAANVRRDFGCDPETKAPYVRRQLAAAAAEAAADPKGKRRRDPFPEARRDEGDCPRPEVYRTLGGRKNDLCEYLRDDFGGPRRCEAVAYQEEVARALVRHDAHVAHLDKNRLHGRLGTAYARAKNGEL